MSNPLPYYSPEQFNHFELLKFHANSFAVAYQNYVQAIERVKTTHDFYHENPALQSGELSYQSALLNLEAAKRSIAEFKDSLYETQMSEWMP